jgi:hypothetical protein
MAHASPQQTAEAWADFILKVALPVSKSLSTSPTEAHSRSPWLAPATGSEL